MTLYSKNGSIPYPHKDESDGWIEVEEAPTPGDGEEVVWWFPPGWVVRPVKPVKEGFDYSWSQTEQRWVEFDAATQEPSEVQPFDPVEPPPEEPPVKTITALDMALAVASATGTTLSGVETITGVQ